MTSQTKRNRRRQFSFSTITFDGRNRQPRKLRRHRGVRVTSTEFQKGFGHYREAALKEPVTITNHGRESLVVMAADEYHRLKRRQRRVMGLADFSDADLAAIEASEIPAEAMAFDHERND